MEFNKQVRVAIILGIVSIILLVLTGIALPILISSEIPLILIISTTSLVVIGLPVCLCIIARLLLIKNKIKKGKCHEKINKKKKLKRPD